MTKTNIGNSTQNNMTILPNQKKEYFPQNKWITHGSYHPGKWVRNYLDYFFIILN